MSGSSLFDAANSNDVAEMEKLLAAGADINYRNANQETPLIQACYKQHTEAVRTLIERSNCDLNAKEKDGWTALHWAATKGNVEIVQMLLQKGADKTIKKNNGSTPVDSSKDASIKEIFDTFGSGGAPAIDLTGLGVFEAANVNNVAALTRQLAGGANINYRNANQETPLIQACYKQHVDAVRVLIAQPNCDLNAKEKDGWTALHWAATKGNGELVQMLLQRGADKTIKKNNGSTPVDSSKDASIKEIFDAYPVGFVPATSSGGSSSAAPIPAVVPVAASSKTTGKLEFGQQLFDAANQNDVAKVAELLSKPNIDINWVNANGETALIQVSYKGHFESAKLLVEHRANLNLKEKDGWTAMHWAAYKAHLLIVRLLLEKGADVTIKKNSGSTALESTKDAGVIELFASFGHTVGGAAPAAPPAVSSVPTIAPVQGGTQHGPELYDAANQNDVERLKQLLGTPGIHLNWSNAAGETALIQAAFKGNTEAATLLVEAGAALDIKEKDGWTALHWASYKGHIAIVKLLLEKGADATIKKNNGTTAQAIAHNGDVTAVFVAFEASQPSGSTAPASATPIQNAAPVTTQPAKDAPVSAPAAVAADTTPQLVAKALQQGSKEWRRSKLSIVGEGRAGKTALTNTIIGRSFTETSSTVGINQLTCDVKHLKTGTTGELGEQLWSECDKAERELETALAQIVAQNKRREAEGHGAAAPTKKGDDIRAYMQALHLEAGKEKQQDEEDSAGNSSAAATILGGGAATNGVSAKPAVKPAQASNPAAPAPTTPPAAHAASPAPQSSEANTSQSTVAKPPKASAVPVEEVALNEEMVMKALATMKDEESGIMISLFDFGGQSVFDVIHHLFLTRNGVYALVFNMEWLTHDGPEKAVALRFMRNWLSSIAIHTFDKTTNMTAPIVFVGTRLDTVPSHAAHGEISSLLYENFSDNLAWRSVLENENGHDRNGKAMLWFYPVDNTQGKQGPTMKNLMSVVHRAIESATYTHKEVPLTWFKVMDRMSDAGRDCLSLLEVTAIGERCGVSAEELPYQLSFLHDMGHLMWINEPGMRDVVILDPISYLVTPATIIICKLTPGKDDLTHHVMPVHRECERMHKKEWSQLKNDGVLSVKLLPLLWKEYLDHSAMLVQLMVKFGLLVPLRSPADHRGSSEVSQYLVPTLLSPANLQDPSIADWTDAPYQSCYFVFTLSEELHLSNTITLADLQHSGFLPGGMFDRLTGKALSWSQDTAKGSSINLQNVILCKDMAVLSFGRQRFRLVNCADMHCVRVDVEGSNPIGIQQKLLDFIHKIIEECMKSLRCFPAVCYLSAGSVEDFQSDPLRKQLLASELLIPLQQLRKAGKGESMLAWRGGRTLLSAADIKSRYGAWLQNYDLRDRYDLFVSYRWGPHDSVFTDALFDMLTNYSVSHNSRAVEVFLDKKRLRDGRQFKADFALALTHSLIAVPVVSVDALTRMLDHSAETVDNVLLEWIIILECFAAKRLMKVFPVLFGARDQDPHSTEVVVLDFFSHRARDLLPKLVPLSTLAQAEELLTANGVSVSSKFRAYTVHSVVNDLMLFLLCKASDHKSSALVETFADKVVALLTDCGEDALHSVVKAPLPLADSEIGAASAHASPVKPQGVPAAAPASPVPQSAASTSAGSTKGPTRPLEDLSVEEVCALMKHVGLKKLVEVFAEKEVNGAMLSYCEEATDLQAEEYGVTSIALARGLLKNIKEWMANGVPVD